MIGVFRRDFSSSSASATLPHRHDHRGVADGRVRRDAPPPLHPMVDGPRVQGETSREDKGVYERKREESKFFSKDNKLKMR